MLRLPAGKMELMDDLGSRGIPFLFVISFDGSEVFVWRRDEVPHGVQFSVPLCRDCGDGERYDGGEIRLEMNPVPAERYGKAFDKVIYHLRRGDTYLINLTMPTAIDAPLTLSQIFRYSNAPYRLLFDGRFVCFSPEIFVRITDGIISSYPMKGTINASVPAAAEKIASDMKEFAEHNTIVDLIRNDLSMVASEVRVKRFRYVERVETNRGALLQVSSEISGKLSEELRRKPGTVMATLLPAGSVTGAPKEKTVEILKEAEGYDRGFYTGVFGYFDGKDLDSGVMIRFIEMQKGRMIFKSGGGITALSDMRREYEELMNKVYVPITGNNKD